MTTCEKPHVAETTHALCEVANEAAAELERSAAATTYSRSIKLRALAAKLRAASVAAEASGGVQAPVGRWFDRRGL